MYLGYDDIKKVPHQDAEKGTMLYPFSPPLYVTKVTEELHELMLQSAKESVEENHFNNHNLASNFIKGDAYTIPSQRADQITSGLQPYIVDYILQCKKDLIILDESVDLSVERTEFWANFQRPGDFNPPHYHGADLSFVSYLLVEDKIFETELDNDDTNSPLSGHITFMRSERQNFVMNGATFIPEDRMLVIFPSWLLHFVMPFQTESIRISMSGNFNIGTVTQG